MFENKNTGGWALALVALGLFLSLVLRDLIRKENPPEEDPVVAAIMPQQEEAPRRVDDWAERFERVTTQCLPFIVTLQHTTISHAQSQTQFSGVLMSAEGYVLTNARLVGAARQVTATLSNKKVLIGEVLGVDTRTELAVVKVTAKGLKGIRQGNSDDLRPGQWVVALGNAALDRHAATAGIVSVKGRGNVWLAEAEDFLQTDAKISANNLGGALVDLQGRLVGINRDAPEQESGSNYVVPINLAREVMRRILAEGKFERGALAVELQELDQNLARGLRWSEASGALVSAVRAEAAHSAAEMQRGDVITKWGEKKITSAWLLRELAAATKPGTTIPITIFRGGAELQRTVTVVASETSAQTGIDERIAQAQHFGLEVEPLTPAYVRELKLAAHTHGVVVAHVQRASAADLAGIRTGDIIQEWEGRAVTGVREFRARLALAPSAPAVLVYVLRHARGFYCALATSAPTAEHAAP